MSTEPKQQATIASEPGLADPAVYRFTVEQYEQLAGGGVFAEKDRVELLQGVVVGMSPIGPDHDFCVLQLSELLRAMLPPGWHVRPQHSLLLPDSVPQPDIAVVRGQVHDYRHRRPHAADVGLVVEVAQASLPRDRSSKLAIYAAAGIEPYWIVNLVDRQIEVYGRSVARRRKQATYVDQEVYDERASVPVTVAGDRIGEIRVADVLP